MAGEAVGASVTQIKLLVNRMNPHACYEHRCNRHHDQRAGICLDRKSQDCTLVAAK
jgi:hypothetical protein